LLGAAVAGAAPWVPSPAVIETPTDGATPVVLRFCSTSKLTISSTRALRRTVTRCQSSWSSVQRRRKAATVNVPLLPQLAGVASENGLLVHRIHSIFVHKVDCVQPLFDPVDLLY
jgi:hypothetical protein